MSTQHKVTREMLSDVIHAVAAAQKIDEYQELLSQLDDEFNVVAWPDYPIEIQLDRFKKALGKMSPDDRRGNGTFEDGKTWLAVIWAGASIGEAAREPLRQWSMLSERYTEEGFNKAFDSYNPNKPNRITAGSLYYHLNTLSESKQISKDSEKNQLINSNTYDTDKHQITEQLQFNFLTVQELQKLTPLAWRVKGLLPETGLASVYGPSGSGKSFFIIDLIAKIALGETFCGHKVTSCPVVYMPLEGTGGVPNRIKAYEKHFNTQLPSTFRIVTERISLLTTDAARFAEAINQNGFQNGVIVIDTLNQSAPEADENTSSDMGTIIKNAQILKKMTNSLVILVHHTGKDARRGARGHSSFFAALDAGIELRKTQSGREWMVSKSKDGEDGMSHPFKLEQVFLGKDEDGEDITSCVISPDIFRAEQPENPTGKNQKAVLAHLKAVMGSTQRTRAEIVAMAKDSINGSNQMTRAKEAVDKLIELGHLVEAGDKYYLFDSFGKNVARFRSPYRGTEKTEKEPELEFSENETKTRNECLPIMRSCVELDAGTLLGP
jgi:hypothetical protein